MALLLPTKVKASPVFYYLFLFMKLLHLSSRSRSDSSTNSFYSTESLLKSPDLTLPFIFEAYLSSLIAQWDTQILTNLAQNCDLTNFSLPFLLSFLVFSLCRVQNLNAVSKSYSIPVLALYCVETGTPSIGDKFV